MLAGKPPKHYRATASSAGTDLWIDSVHSSSVTFATSAKSLIKLTWGGKTFALGSLTANWSFLFSHVQEQRGTSGHEGIGRRAL